MKISLRKEVYDLLKRESEDVERLVNEIAEKYSRGELIQEDRVAAKFYLERVYRKNSAMIAEIFDEMTHEYKGVAVVGRKSSESLWISSPFLHDTLEENDVIVVIKSPRKTGISVEDDGERYAWIPTDDDIN